MTRDVDQRAAAPLKRVVGVPGAILMGLGSILGTGVFVSLGIAAGVAGPTVVLCTLLAALVATFNGLSSAQLAASHPVSGGTYEYGYRYLSPSLGFTAGWMFLCAKSASAASAALGFAAYVAALVPGADHWVRPLALLAVGTLTLLVTAGIQRSSRANSAIVGITLVALVAFMLGGVREALAHGAEHLNGQLLASRPAELLHGTALMFVAFTGYGRIATLGEEVRDPQRSIPRAIIATLLCSALLYVGVALVAVAAVGAQALTAATGGVAAPLELVARSFQLPGLPYLVALGAVSAMLGVLLNLVLGLSRVAMAMGRRGDMPRVLGRLDAQGSPRAAVLFVGILIAALTTLGSVKLTWSFSAFTVLVYYALTNLAALRIPEEHRRYPRAVAWCGLVCCLGLAFWSNLQCGWQAARCWRWDCYGSVWPARWRRKASGLLVGCRVRCLALRGRDSRDSLSV